MKKERMKERKEERNMGMITKPPCRSSGGEAPVELWQRTAVALDPWLSSLGRQAVAAKQWPPS